MLGANILEIDITKSSDGKLYVFHDGSEERLLNYKENLLNVPSFEIEKMIYLNGIASPTDEKIQSLEYMMAYIKSLLEQSKDVYVNIDRAWDYLNETLCELDKYNLTEYLIIKTPFEDRFLNVLEKHSIKYMYMPILYKEEEFDKLDDLIQNENINLVGVEFSVKSTGAKFSDMQIYKNIKSENLYLWANTIRLSSTPHLLQEYDDNVSIEFGFDKGWGVIADMGFDIIQTDWTPLLHSYREKRNSK